MLLQAVNDRRATYDDFSSGIAYLSFWLALLIVLLLTWKNDRKDIETFYAVIILASVASSIVFGGYPGRFLAAARISPAVVVDREALYR